MSTQKQTFIGWGDMSIYLDCNATTPIEPRVRDKMLHFLDLEYGNAASRTHIWGTRAKQAVQQAREQIANVVNAKTDEVIFTSGATESNNLAILGLAAHMRKVGRKHIITTNIEHKAVLEPVSVLENMGFEVSYVSPGGDGRVSSGAIINALRPDTGIVSVMHVNNETGVIQPIDEIASFLHDHDTFFHVDAAQGYGKIIGTLQHKRIDLISISGHKIFAPKGIGALITRRRGFKRLPLAPIMFGGGHENGLRPGTLPVHLIVALGEASAIAMEDHSSRHKTNYKFRESLLHSISEFKYQINGDSNFSLPHVLNISFYGVNSEAALVALKDEISISNGSACTSHSYDLSHVLMAMDLSDDRIKSALRISWCHLTPEVNWAKVVSKIKVLQAIT